MYIARLNFSCPSSPLSPLSLGPFPIGKRSVFLLPSIYELLIILSSLLFDTCYLKVCDLICNSEDFSKYVSAICF